MKKSNRFSHGLAGILAVGAMCAAIPMLSGSAALAGDVNLDGQVGVQDVVLLQKYLLNKQSISQEAFKAADINGDGKVNIYDLILNKKQVISGKTPEEPQPTETEPVETDAPISDTIVASIVYNNTSVSLYGADGTEIAASDATNVTVDGAYVTITVAGEYSVSGSSSEGQLKVNTDNNVDATAAVTLSFEDLTLSNSSVAPVYVENVGDAVTISVKKGTTNTISDGTEHTDTYTNSSGELKEINSAIFSRDDLKIKGKGTLIVNGNYQDGLVSKNDLKLWNGDIQVTAVDDGIKGGNSVRIGDPDTLAANGGDGDYSNLKVTVKTSAGDGIKSTETDTGKGFVTINGGTVNINSYADGIQAEQEFTMNGGDVTIYTYQGSNFTASGSSDTGSTDPWSWGGSGGGMGMDGNANKTDISAKGIKSVGLYDEAGTTWQSGGNLTINGGTLVIDSSDDALHCGGDMSVVGGNLTLSSADDGMHSDHSLTIGQGSANTFDDVQIYIPKCYEGVEGVTINQNSGTVYIISGDDGYNAAGGADGSGSGNTNPWGGGMMSTSSGTLNLNGGFVVVNSANGDHDAFDSNGNFTVTGGYYCANGQEPMDYDGSFSNNGGSFITMQAGNTNLTTRYSFVDNSGNVIVSFVSASGGGLYSGSSASAQSGGTVSGGTTVLEQAGDKSVTVGGTLSGGQALGQSSGSTQPGGPGGRG